MHKKPQESNSHPPSFAETRTSHMVMPGDTNPHGGLFGGALVGWMDLSAVLCSQKHASGQVVTARIDAIDFVAPARPGQHVTITAVPTFAGNTSVEVMVTAEAQYPESGSSRVICSAIFTMVRVTPDGHTLPVPKVEPETEEQKLLYEEGKQRYESRRKSRS
ncbi:MAG: acyl-CoA thioesterase [Planctomycetes bacterium]|nr:acyl-CoA thioesterase [Planctomycetota bacterium]